MKNRLALKLILAALIALAVIVVIWRFDLVHSLNFYAVRKYIISYGKFAVLIFILFFAIRTVFLIPPYSVMVVLAGSLFGPIRGFTYSMVGIALAAGTAFYLSKLLGKEVLERFLLRGKLKELGPKVEKHGFKVIFFMRISSLFPFDVLGFAAGLTKIKFRDFILGTVLGMIPETFILTYVGNNLKNPFSPKFVIAIILIIVIVAASIMFKKSQFNELEKDGKKENTDEEKDI